MAEYIEREKVRDMLHSEIDSWGSCPDEINALLYANDKLFEIPAADVAPVVHGRWEHHENGIAYCSECEMDAVEDGTDYCPNCGAKMDAEEIRHETV